MASKAAESVAGGLAAIVSPDINPDLETEAQIPTPSLGDSISVALGLDTGFEFESQV